MVHVPASGLPCAPAEQGAGQGRPPAGPSQGVAGPLLQLHRVRATRLDDMLLLRRFHDEVYVPGFPDPDERADLETIEHNLLLREQGWYGDNNFHVLICTAGDDVPGGAIADYLALPNAGVIEYLVIAPGLRSQGLGSRLLAETERALAADAAAAGAQLRCVYAEVEDPRRAEPVAGSFDPAVRARIWRRWGYQACAFPYVQPALSAVQQPVETLLLAAKPMQAEALRALPGTHLSEVVLEYLRWAMHISAPAENGECQRMLQFLRHHPLVPLQPLIE